MAKSIVSCRRIRKRPRAGRERFPTLEAPTLTPTEIEEAFLIIYFERGGKGGKKTKS